MKALFRGSLCAGILGILLAGGGYASPRWATRLGIDFQELAALERQLAESHRFREELERQSDAVFQNLAAREEIMRGIRECQITLPEAAARFRDLFVALPGSRWELFRQYFAGATDGERFCRQVIAFAHGEQWHNPEATEAVARLEAELGEMLKQGPIYLPED